MKLPLFTCAALATLAGCSQLLNLDDYRVAGDAAATDAASTDAGLSADAIAAQRSDWARWPLPTTYDTTLDGATPVTPLSGGTSTLGTLFTFNNTPSPPLTYEEARSYCTALGTGWELPTRIELVALWDLPTTSTVNLPREVVIQTGESTVFWSQTRRNVGGAVVYWVGEFRKDNEEFLRAQAPSASGRALCIRRSL